ARSPFDLVIISLAMTTCGFMFIPAWSALLGDYSEESNRGTFIGRVGSFGTYFSVPVIVIVGLTMDLFFQDPKSGNVGAYWIPFGLSSTVFLITAGIALFLNEKYSQLEYNKKTPKDSLSIRDLIRQNHSFSRLLTIDAFFKFSMSLAWPVFPYVALKVANSWLELSFLWAVFNFPRALGQAYGGRYADRYGKKRVLLISRIMYFTVPGLYFLGMFADAFIFLFIGGITGGFALGGEEVSIISYSLDCSTEETKATYYSILLFTEGWVMFTGSILAGIIMSVLQTIGIEFEAVLLLMLAMITLLRILFALLHFFLDSTPTPPVLINEISSLT
ncbi:MAG: MFS transporter, partial [Candidatus Hodarchaeales archaeon]